MNFVVCGTSSISYIKYLKLFLKNYIVGISYYVIFAQLIVQIVIVVILIAFLVILYKYFSEKNTPYNISGKSSMCYKDKKFVMAHSGSLPELSDEDSRKFPVPTIPPWN